MFVRKKNDEINSKKNSSGKVLSINLDGFCGEDGKFDYQIYKKIQTEGNIKKIKNVWVQRENIEYISEYIFSSGLNPSFGICHGTRRGLEQKWFSECLKCDVIGTEISDTANDFPNTIQWDFHDVKEEWIGSVDFIYSNSLDHSYDPGACLRNWMSCLKPGGVCVLEHSEFHGIKGVSELDPFGAELIIMPYVILIWSEGLFSVREILDAPKKPSNVNELKFLVIQNNQPKGV